MLAPQFGIFLHTPCIWYYCPSHLSSRRDDLRLPCLLAQTLMPLESILNFSDAIIVFHFIILHYIFSDLWVENRIFNKVLFYLIFYTDFNFNKSIKYSIIDKKDNPPDTNASGFYRRVGGGKIRITKC